MGVNKYEKKNEMGRGIERQARGGKMREITDTKGPLKRHETTTAEVS